MAEDVSQPQTIDISRLREFADIPLKHFNILQTRVNDGVRMTVFTSRDRVKAWLQINIVDRKFKLKGEAILRFIAGTKVALNEAAKAEVECLARTIVEEGSNDERPPLQIAEGKARVNGVDSRVDWKVQIGVGAGEVSSQVEYGENEQVDHRERKKLETVGVDDVICVVSPPTAGEDGLDIFGKPIKAQDGKWIAFDCGEGVEINKDKTEYRATDSGFAKIKDKALSVTPVLFVKEVSFGSGNIEYKGNVEVDGDVKEGFSVTAGRDLNVGGIIKDATIRCGGTLKTQALLGEKTSAVCGGDITVARVVNARVAGGKNLTVTQELINAGVTVAGACNGAEATMVGGTLHCLGPVYLAALGSPDGAGAVQQVRIELENLCVGELAELEDDLRESRAAADKIRAGLEPIVRNPAMTQKLPAGTLEAVKKLTVQLGNLHEHMKQVEERKKKRTIDLQKRIRPELYVKRLYPGSKVVLNGVAKTFPEGVATPVRVSFDKKLKDIVVEPWTDAKADAEK